MTQVVYTEADFDELNWHDCQVWGFELRVDDYDEDDNPSPVSDLVLKIDYITEWLCGTDGHCHFMIAPATLVFHDVTNLSMSMDFGQVRGHRIAPQAPDIYDIRRESPPEKDALWFHWTLELSGCSRSGSITFDATRFTQTVFGDPILCEGQRLTVADRDRMMGKNSP